MLQSLSMKDYPDKLFQEFGFTAYDECFPYKQHIHTDKGAVRIGSLYEKWENKEELPKILSFNKKTKQFEYKNLTTLITTELLIQLKTQLCGDQCS